MALWARLRSFWHNVVHRSEMEETCPTNCSFTSSAAPRTSSRGAASLRTTPGESRGSSSDRWRNSRKRLGRASGSGWWTNGAATCDMRCGPSRGAKASRRSQSRRSRSASARTRRSSASSTRCSFARFRWTPRTNSSCSTGCARRIRWWRATPDTAGRDRTDSGFARRFPPSPSNVSEHTATLADVFAFSPTGTLNIVADRQADTASGLFVTGRYFAGLGVRAALGRTLSTADDRPDAEPVAVISHRYWRRRFAGDPGVVGKTIDVNRLPVAIVGVTPEGFDGPRMTESNDITLPVAAAARLDSAGRARPASFWWLQMMARLRPGVTREQALAELHPIFAETVRESWAARPPDTPNPGRSALPQLRVRPGAQGPDGPRLDARDILAVSFAVVGAILLIGCVNLATLLLVRASARRQEITVRVTMGASRGRVVRQLLTEILLLALVGGIGGAILAWWGKEFMTWLPSRETPIVDARLDLRVLAFTAGLSTIAALLFGIGPALRATRPDLAASLRTSSQRGRPGPRRRQSGAARRGSRREPRAPRQRGTAVAHALQLQQGRRRVQRRQRARLPDRSCPARRQRVAPVRHLRSNHGGHRIGSRRPVLHDVRDASHRGERVGRNRAAGWHWPSAKRVHPGGALELPRDDGHSGGGGAGPLGRGQRGTSSCGRHQRDDGSGRVRGAGAGRAVFPARERGRPQRADPGDRHRARFEVRAPRAAGAADALHAARAASRQRHDRRSTHGVGPDDGRLRHSGSGRAERSRQLRWPR